MGKVLGHDKLEEEQNGNGGASEGASRFIRFDLASPDCVVQVGLPTLDVIYNRFARLFDASLSGMLRQPTNVFLSNNGPLRYSEFINSLPLPSCVSIVELSPLKRPALMVIESSLVFALTDVLMGGRDIPHTKIQGKDYTPIEIEIAQMAVRKALLDLQVAWEPVFPVKPSLVRTEINPQFVAAFPSSDVVIVTNFDVDLEKVSGTIKIVIPYG